MSLPAPVELGSRSGIPLYKVSTEVTESRIRCRLQAISMYPHTIQMSIDPQGHKFLSLSQSTV